MNQKDLSVEIIYFQNISQVVRIYPGFSPVRFKRIIERRSLKEKLKETLAGRSGNVDFKGVWKIEKIAVRNFAENGAS